MTFPGLLDGETLTLSQLKKLLKGDQGIQGWEGHTPIHVQEAKPTGVDVNKGDLWYQPSTEKWFGNTGSAWKEIAKRGIQGLEGERGKDGKDGKQGPKGERGPAGEDGKDADISQVLPIAESVVKRHEAAHNHDPFLLGTKKVSEAGIADGMVVQYDAKGDRLVYANVKQVASQVSRLAGRGLSLPSQSGNSGKYLTTDGSRASWSTVVGGSGITRSVNVISTNTNAGSTASTDYVYFVSGTTTLTLPTAVGNTNQYQIKNTGSNTVTIATTLAQTIDGSSTISLAVANTAITVISDGSNWQIV